MRGLEAIELLTVVFANSQIPSRSSYKLLSDLTLLNIQALFDGFLTRRPAYDNSFLSQLTMVGNVCGVCPM